MGTVYSQVHKYLSVFTVFEYINAMEEQPPQIERDFTDTDESETDKEGTTDTGTGTDEGETSAGLPLDLGNVHPCKKCEREKDPFKGFPAVPKTVKELVNTVIIPSIFCFPENLKKDQIEHFEHNVHFHLLEYFEELYKRKENEKAMQLQDLFELK